MNGRRVFFASGVLAFFLLVACSSPDDGPKGTPTSTTTSSASGTSSGSGGTSSSSQTGSGGAGTSTVATGGGSGGTDTGGAGGAGTGGSGALDASADVGSTDDASTDARNDSVVAGDSGITDPGIEGDGRFPVMKKAIPPEATARLAGVMAGTTQTLQIPAAMGSQARSVQVYTPAGYVPNTPIAFMVFHDGSQGMQQLRYPIILDNLAFQKKIPMMVSIYVPPVDRSREYDTVNANFTQYITTQVLPAVEARNIKLTTDPEASGVSGHSSGGILAFTMAWFQPERYRRVLSLSGSFLSLQNPGGDLYDNLVRTTMPLKPIRVAMIAGTNDLNPPRWTQANEKMGMALQAASYHYRYLLIDTGTHNPPDNLAFLPEQLVWLWRGYPVTGPTR